MRHIHCTPVGDLIEHDTDHQEDCVCGPRVDRHETPYGDVWVYVHHSLDRREEQELRYRKRPVEIEARQLVGTTSEMHAVYLWVEANTEGSFDPAAEEIPASGVSIDPSTGFMLIATLEGVVQASPGDWIIRGIAGEFYPCKPEIFEATYDRVDDDRDEPAVEGLVTARIIIERRLTEDDLIDYVTAEDGEGGEMPLAEALGMLRLAEHSLISDRLDDDPDNAGDNAGDDAEDDGS